MVHNLESEKKVEMQAQLVADPKKLDSKKEELKSLLGQENFQKFFDSIRNEIVTNENSKTSESGDSSQKVELSVCEFLPQAYKEDITTIIFTEKLHEENMKRYGKTHFFD